MAIKKEHLISRPTVVGLVAQAEMTDKADMRGDFDVTIKVREDGVFVDVKPATDE